jgi:hypothetical protein
MPAQKGFEPSDQVPDLPMIPRDLDPSKAPPLGPVGSVPSEGNKPNRK